jgi:hypothetical protein
MIWYDTLVTYFNPLGIDDQLLYLYIFNFLAIELGALVPLYALLASRPSTFLERIRNTSAFRYLISNLLITIAIMAIGVIYTLVIGILKLEPSRHLSTPSFVFLVWICLCCQITAFYVRAIRLSLLALVIS